MYNKYPVMWEDKKTGEVYIQETEGNISINANIDMNKLPANKPFRLCAVCTHGNVNIGIPVPQNECLVLKKRYNAYQIEQNEIKDIEGFVLCSVEDTLEEKQNDFQWHEEPNPGQLFADAELQYICRSVIGAFSRELGEGITELAVPADPYQPFPLLPIFQFGNVERIKEKLFIGFKLKNGKLVD